MDGSYVHVKPIVCEIRWFSGGRQYDRGEPFDHIVNVNADEDLAIIRGLRAYTPFALTLQNRHEIAEKLMALGFERVCWDRYKERRCEDGEIRRIPYRVVFKLKTWRRVDVQMKNCYRVRHTARI